MAVTTYIVALILDEASNNIPVPRNDVHCFADIKDPPSMMGFNRLRRIGNRMGHL